MYEQKWLTKYFAAINVPIFVTGLVNTIGAKIAYHRPAFDWRHNSVLEAAAVLFAIIGATNVVATIYLLVRRKQVQYRERRVTIAAALCLPFVVASNVYLISTAFAGPSNALSPLSNTSTGVLTDALFTFIPDCAVLGICFWTGSVLKLAETNPEKAARMRADAEAGTRIGVDREIADERGTQKEAPPYTKNDKPEGIPDDLHRGGASPDVRSGSITLHESAPVDEDDSKDPKL